MGAEKFDLNATVSAIGQACTALFCHALFDAALHGLAVALTVGLVGLILSQRRQRFGKPLMAVSAKLAMFCAALLLPGLIALITSGHLPAVGVFQFSSLGFVVFWGLISLHLSAEEMNFEWFS
jgi:predicted branched-subunit amino acid permease